MTMAETSTGFGRRITVPTVFPVVYVVASEDMDSLTFGARFFYASMVGCVGFEGRIYQVRFQPRVGQFLAAPTGSVVSLFDVETDRQQLHISGTLCRGTLRLLGYKCRLLGIC